MSDLSINRARSLFFKALSNQSRVEIIGLLRNGPAGVSEISAKLSLDQTAVSHNLKCLSFCGFVKNRREGKRSIYSLNSETVEPLLQIADRHVSKYAQNLFECTVLER